MHLPSVQLTGSPRGEHGVAVRAREGLPNVLLLEGLFTVDVVHFDVRSPTLPRQNGLAPDMHTAKVQFCNLVVLLINLRGVYTGREDDVLSRGRWLGQSDRWLVGDLDSCARASGHELRLWWRHQVVTWAGLVANVFEELLLKGLIRLSV